MQHGRARPQARLGIDGGTRDHTLIAEVPARELGRNYPLPVHGNGRGRPVRQPGGAL